MKTTFIVINSTTNKVPAAPYKVNMAKVTGKWVDGKYQMRAETLGGGMSNDPLLQIWCRMQNEAEGVKTKELHVDFMLLTDEMVTAMNNKKDW